VINLSKETIRDIHNIWDRLEDNPARADLADGHILHQPVIGKEGARIGIDSKFRFHIILQPKDSDEEFNRKLTNDIHIKTKDINIEGTASRQVNIIAGKRWRHAIEPFAAEVIDSMVNGSVSLSTLRNLVEEYRSLWASPKEPLNPRRQRGIIAELKVLEDLGKFIGHAQSMQKWSGSLSSKSGGLHDIGDEIFAIEVKSYHEEPPRVRINGIEQLDHRIDKRLTLVGVHIISHQEGMTLPGYIDHCLKIYDEAGCKSVAEEKLNLAGWRDSDREEYHSKFTIGRTVIVPIRPDTPVFPAHLKDRIPSSVSGISYLLHLNDLHALPSDKENSWKEMILEEPWPTIDDQSLTSESLISTNCKEIHAKATEELVILDESQNLEFKSSVWYPYEPPKNETLTSSEITKEINEATIKTISGFLNSEGGTLLIGLNDDNEILGLNRDLKASGTKDMDNYELRLVKLLSDKCGRANIAEFVRVTFCSIGENQICRLDVRPSTTPVFTENEKFYVRVGNATNSLFPSEMYDYCIRHWGL
tara:strand:+ start:1594 stop:3189 length:1596 start_codon:yes stop_codon:yes gene_type:complete